MATTPTHKCVTHVSPLGTLNNTLPPGMRLALCGMPCLHKKQAHVHAFNACRHRQLRTSNKKLRTLNKYTPAQDAVFIKLQCDDDNNQCVI